MAFIPCKIIRAFVVLACIGFFNLVVICPNQSASAAEEAIIADHTVVDQYDKIPKRWMDEIKKMRLNVPGESHSYAYRKGVLLLMGQDARFAASVTEEGSPESYREDALRVDRLVRNQYNKWSEGIGEAGWYTGYVNSDGSVNESGIQYLKNHITYCNTNSLEIAVIGFGWCWDTTWHNSPSGESDAVHFVRWAGSSVGGPNGDERWGLDADDYDLTGNRVCMDTYLSATQAYIAHCQTNGYPTGVIYTTGPVDGYTGENGYQRYLKHEYIRAYVLANEGILFDYADILCWGNDGIENTISWTDFSGTP